MNHAEACLCTRDDRESSFHHRGSPVRLVQDFGCPVMLVQDCLCTGKT